MYHLFTHRIEGSLPCSTSSYSAASCLTQSHPTCPTPNSRWVQTGGGWSCLAGGRAPPRRCRGPAQPTPPAARCRPLSLPLRCQTPGCGARRSPPARCQTEGCAAAAPGCRRRLPASGRWCRPGRPQRLGCRQHRYWHCLSCAPASRRPAGVGASAGRRAWLGGLRCLRCREWRPWPTCRDRQGARSAHRRSAVSAAPVQPGCAL